MKPLTLLLLGSVIACGIPTAIGHRTKRSEPLFDVVANLFNHFESVPFFIMFLKQILNDTRAKHVLGSRAPETAELLGAYLDLFNATIPDGRTATEVELRDIAKRISNELSNEYWTNFIRNDTSGLFHGVIMDKQAIVVLKNIVKNNPIKESGNNLVELIAAQHLKTDDLSMVAKHIKYVAENWRMSTSTLPTHISGDGPGSNQFFAFMVAFIIDDYLRLRRSEDYALYSIKNFAGLVEALKDPESYDSFEAFSKGLARSKYFEAWDIIVRNVIKCHVAPLSAEDQKRFHEATYEMLQAARFYCVDRSKVKVEESEHIETHREGGSMITSYQLGDKLDAAYEVEENRKNFAKCILGEEDRKLLREVMWLETELLGEEQLDELRAKNEKVYAVVSLANNATRAVRNRESLGLEAEAFMKRLETTPHTLMWLSEQFVPTAEVLQKVNEEKSRMIRKFNELSDEAKEELVEAYPFRSFLTFASLQ